MWVQFTYHWENSAPVYTVKTSDERELNYALNLKSVSYLITKVSGTHSIPVSYEYNKDLLVKKILPEGRFVGILYEGRKVKSLMGPNPSSGIPEATYTFTYGKEYTDSFDALGIKTRYIYDNRSQLTTY